MRYILKEELKRCIDYFKNNANCNKNTEWYGLTRDKYVKHGLKKLNIKK